MDILSILRKSNAQLLVAEEPEPLRFASRGHVNVPLTSSTSSQCNYPQVEHSQPVYVQTSWPMSWEESLLFI